MTDSLQVLATPHCHVDERTLRRLLAEAVARIDELEALAKEGIELAIRTHPNNGPEMRRKLESGELERLMGIIGADVFDPTGRCRFALKARKLLDS